MYRNPSYSGNNDWENANQSERGNNNFQQFDQYFNNRSQGRGQGSYSQPARSQNRDNDYDLRGENRRNQDYNTDYDYQQPYRNQDQNFRGSYRFDNETNDSGYRQLHERNFGSEYGYGQQGNSRSGGDYGRSQSDYGNSSRYGSSRNMGSMGSYGGAQGFGSSRNGFSSDKWGSGHKGVQHQPHHTVYGAYRDKNSFAPGEKESYDGSQRSGSQGADNTRGWVNPGRSGRSGSYQHRTSEDDSRYEIYDTSESQYNHGEYNNDTRGSISDDLDQHTHQQYSPREVYGSRERSRNRQGSGSDQDRYLGSDLGYQNTAGSLYPEYGELRNQSGTSNRYFNAGSDSWNSDFDRR